VKTKTLLLNGIAVGDVPATGDANLDAEAARQFLDSRGLLKPVPLERRIFNQAVAFSSTAAHLHKSGLSGPPPHDGRTVSPFIVNSAFACELYLKALAQLHGKSLRGHELISLYAALPVAAKQAIANTSPVAAQDRRLPSDTKIKPVLTHLNDAFVTWRYVYERERTKAVEIEPTIFAMQALHQAYLVSEAA
jgi:hypothetical protein